MEKENKNEIQPDENRPPTIEEQAAGLQELITADRSDLDLMVKAGEVSDEEAASFKEEIESKELLLSFYHQTLEQLNEEHSDDGNQHSVDPVEADNGTKIVEVDYAKIGWIDGADTANIPVEKVGRPDTPVYLGSIVDQDRVTKSAADELEAQGEWDGLFEKLKNDTLPQLWSNIREGRGRVRPISIGNRSPKEVKAANSLNTSYPAYKEPVLGTNNRAIVLLVDRIGEDPVFVLVAMYDHDDQQRVLNHTFLKSK